MKWVAVGIIVSLALAMPELALAHAVVIQCDPPIGANVRMAPAKIECQFSEPLDLERSQLAVFDSAGARVDRGDTQALGGDTARLVVTLDQTKMPDGLYTVRWSVVDTIDFGYTESEFQFGLNMAVPPTPTPALPGVAMTPQNFYTPAEGASGANELVSRFLIGAGIALLAGMGVVFWRMRRGASEGDPESRGG
jgi:copper transport protein